MALPTRTGARIRNADTRNGSDITNLASAITFGLTALRAATANGARSLDANREAIAIELSASPNFGPTLAEPMRGPVPLDSKDTAPWARSTLAAWSRVPTATVDLRSAVIEAVRIRRRSA